MKDVVLALDDICLNIGFCLICGTFLCLCVECCLRLDWPLKRKCFLQVRFPELLRTEVFYLNLNNFL